MKKPLLNLLLIFALTSVVSALNAQGPPTQWKFYLAFEDATGAKDTIWIGLDENGTVGNLNPDLGEVPVQLDSTEFNVWMNVYPSMEAFKTYVGSINHSPSIIVFGMNQVLPITLSWDTAFFNSPVLQETMAGPICNPRLESSWFENYTNAVWLHNQYSMVFDNHVVLPEAPWLLQPHFPMTFYTDRNHICEPLDVNNTDDFKQLVLFPNPCTDYLELRTDAVLQQVKVYDLNGRVVLSRNGTGNGSSSAPLRLNVRALPAGMYLLSAVDVNGRSGVQKFMKGNH